MAKKRSYKINKYRVLQIKTCHGHKIAKWELNSGYHISFSTDDINAAYIKKQEFEERIEKTGKHTSSCLRWYPGKKCKAKFEVRETE